MASDETNRIYDRANLGNSAGYGRRPALLSIDLQYGFTDSDHPLGGDFSSVIDRSNELIRAARRGDVPVVFTRVVTKHPDAADLGVWRNIIPELKTFTPESRWVQLDDRLDIESQDHVLDKRQASVFHETELASMLTNWGIDTVVLTGCTTSGCIRASAIDACASGYRAIVPEEAAGDRAAEPHDANLFDIQAKYGDVRPTTEVGDYLAEPRP